MANTTKPRRRKVARRFVPQPDVPRTKKVAASRYPHLIDMGLATLAALSLIVMIVAP